jgi:hypothetical protein
MLAKKIQSKLTCRLNPIKCVGVEPSIYPKSNWFAMNYSVKTNAASLNTAPEMAPNVLPVKKKVFARTFC